MKQIRNGIFVLIISSVALWISQILSYHWHTAIISKKTFRVVWGVIYPGYVLGWVSKILTFFPVGLIVTFFARTKYGYLCAIASGFIECGIVDIINSGVNDRYGR